MKTNTDVTLYHKKYNEETRMDYWEKQYIESAMWQGGIGASVNKGYIESNDISIYIPYSKNKELKNIQFAIGDIVVKGKIEMDINKQSDLDIESFNITTIIDNNYSSKAMQHIFIGAK